MTIPHIISNRPRPVWGERSMYYYYVACCSCQRMGKQLLVFWSSWSLFFLYFQLMGTFPNAASLQAYLAPQSVLLDYKESSKASNHKTFNYY